MARPRTAPLTPVTPTPGGPLFLVKITAISSGNHSFDEWWLDPTNAAAKKVGGRYAGTANPGRAVTGATFAVGDFALAKSAEGAGGLTWELYPLGGAPAAISSWKTPPARARTTTTLPSCTYSNGTSGVGATLTATANAALAAQDGVTLAAADVLLVANQASAFQNGIYTVTQLGSGSLPFVLTRRADADATAELPGAAVAVLEGTLYADTAWLCTTNAPVTVGTTAINWRDISGDVYGPSGATNNYIALYDGTTGKKIKQDTLYYYATASGLAGGTYYHFGAPGAPYAHTIAPGDTFNPTVAGIGSWKGSTVGGGPDGSFGCAELVVLGVGARFLGTFSADGNGGVTAQGSTAIVTGVPDFNLANNARVSTTVRTNGFSPGGMIVVKNNTTGGVAIYRIDLPSLLSGGFTLISSTSGFSNSSGNSGTINVINNSIAATVDIENKVGSTQKISYAYYGA